MSSTAPRAIIRNDVVEILRDLLGDSVPVFDMYARDFKKGLDRLVAVFSPAEYITPVDGNGEARGGRPLQRQITIDILIAVQEAGDGKEAADIADDISRQIELKINRDHGDMMTLTSVTVDLATEEKISCLIEMSYSVDYTDLMNDE